MVDNKVFVESLGQVGGQIVWVNLTNGWNVCSPESWDHEYKIPSALALIHSEVSEGLESYRRDNHEEFAEDMADVFIRLLDLTSGLGIDLGTEVLKKIEKNRGRGYRHGGKKV